MWMLLIVWYKQNCLDLSTWKSRLEMILDHRVVEWFFESVKDILIQHEIDWRRESSNYLILEIIDYVVQEIHLAKFADKGIINNLILILMNNQSRNIRFVSRLNFNTRHFIRVSSNEIPKTQIVEHLIPWNDDWKWLDKSAQNTLNSHIYLICLSNHDSNHILYPLFSLKNFISVWCLLQDD